jgi:S1-C subfamily serine protease
MRNHSSEVCFIAVASATLIFVSSSARAADTAPADNLASDITQGLSKGFGLLGGLMDSVFSPTAADFKKKVVDGKVDEALALYAANSKEFKARKELEQPIKSLLSDARRLKASILEPGIAQVAEQRAQRGFINDPVGFRSSLDAMQRDRTAYVGFALLADNAPSDPNLQRLDAEVLASSEAVVADMSEVYQAFPHERISFDSVFPAVADQGALLRAALPKLSARLSQLDERGRKTYVLNTSVAWKTDAALQADLSDVLIERLSSNSSPLGRLKAANIVDDYGLRSTDARNRPFLFVVDSPWKTGEGTAQFDNPADGRKSLQQAKDYVVDTGAKAAIFVILDESRTSRKITDKKDVESTYVSGRRRVPNSQYELARINCQRAQSDAAAQNARNTMTPQRSILGAVLQGISSGISEGSASRVCQQFAETRPYLEEDVYTPYSYVVSEIEVSSISRGRVVVTGAVPNGADSYPFNSEDKKTYRVAYGKKDADRSGTTELITDAELERVASTVQSVNPRMLALSVDPNSKQIGDGLQLASIFEPLKPQAVFPLPITAGVVQTSANSRGGVQPAAFMSQSPSRPDGNADVDPRMNSVVVVLNPKGSLGAGFYVEPNLVLTNFHVIEGASTVELRAFDGSLFTGKVVRRDIQLDLALLRVERVGPPTQFASTVLKPGETVEAIGHPRGLTFSLSRGVVSAVRQMKGALAQGGDKALLIQTDTPINPGNSGGPLFSNGRVVGVNTMKFKGAEGIGFAVHYTEIVRFLSEQ